VTVSPPKSSEPYTGPYRKPRADVYTFLLIVALLALIIACLCLWGEMQLYEMKIKGGPPVGFLAPSAPSRAPDRTPVPLLACQQCRGVTVHWLGTGSFFGTKNVPVPLSAVT
jgi:hypothetical protein